MAQDEQHDDQNVLHIDRDEILAHRFDPALMPEPGQSWCVDELAANIPWRAPISVSDAVLFTRLVVLRGHEDARAALNKARGRREREHTARYGPLNLPDPVADLERGDESPYATFAGGSLAAALGVIRRPNEDAVSFAARIREAGKSSSGRLGAHDLRVFVRVLALWWWRNTGRTPNGRTSVVPARPDRRRKRPVTFLEFVKAAFSDAGGRGTIERSVRTTLDEMNRADPPPPWPRRSRSR